MNVVCRLYVVCLLNEYIVTKQLQILYYYIILYYIYASGVKTIEKVRLSE